MRAYRFFVFATTQQAKSVKYPYKMSDIKDSIEELKSMVAGFCVSLQDLQRNNIKAELAQQADFIHHSIYSKFTSGDITSNPRHRRHI